MRMARLNRIATSVPEDDAHGFVGFADKMLGNPRLRTVFSRMVNRGRSAASRERRHAAIVSVTLVLIALTI